jgi:hypothetical protein
MGLGSSGLKSSEKSVGNQIGKMGGDRQWM